MQTVKIKSIDKRTHVFIDDRELKDITSILFDQSAGEIPSLTFETFGAPDIETDNADISFKFTPETISDAAKVIRHSFSTETELYDALAASIASALKEIPSDTGVYDVAKAVADRIMGEE